MAKLENRNDIRVINQIQILELIREGRKTITNIAENLGISFTAASNILNEMYAEGLIVFKDVNSQKNKRGRIPSYVEFNVDKGVVCGIDLSSRNIEIVLCTLDGKIVTKETIENAFFIEQKHLEEIETAIKKLLASKEVNGRKLLSICIASPGQIRPENYEYANVYRVKEFAKMNPVLYFKNAFNVHVEMHNDIRIGCLGELKYGAFPKEPFNGLFVHIGLGVGVSFVINGKIYKGTNGFAGEVPTFTEKDNTFEKYWNGQVYGIWLIGRNVNKEKGKETTITENFDISALAKAYQDGDPIVKKYVEESAKKNAITLISMATYLDLECIVIEGPILKFGDSYLSMLRKYVLEYSQIEIRTQIIASTTVQNCSILGVCYQAISSYLLKQLQTMARKRLGQQDFKISNSYKEI